MPTPFSFGNLEVKLESEAETLTEAPEPDAPFHIIILGDFTGRTNRQVFESGPELTARSPVPVDRDNFDNLPARLGVGLCLPIASDGLRNRSEGSEEPEKRRKSDTTGSAGGLMSSAVSKTAYLQILLFEPRSALHHLSLLARLYSGRFAPH